MKKAAYVKNRNVNMDYMVVFYKDGGATIKATQIYVSGDPGKQFSKYRPANSVPDWIKLAAAVADIADRNKPLPLPDGWVVKYVYPNREVYHFYSINTFSLPKEKT